ALGPYRIGEDVHGVELHERRRMIDECDAKLAGRRTLRWRRSVRCVDQMHPIAAIAVENPFEEIAFALPSRTGIVKAMPIEVIADRTAVSRRRKKASFDRSRRRGGAGRDGNRSGTAHRRSLLLFQVRGAAPVSLPCAWISRDRRLCRSLSLLSRF